MRIEKDLLPYILVFLFSGSYFVMAIINTIKAVKEYGKLQFSKKADNFIKRRSF